MPANEKDESVIVVDSFQRLNWPSYQNSRGQSETGGEVATVRQFRQIDAPWYRDVEEFKLTLALRRRTQNSLLILFWLTNLLTIALFLWKAFGNNKISDTAL